MDTLANPGITALLTPIPVEPHVPAVEVAVRIAGSLPLVALNWRLTGMGRAADAAFLLACAAHAAATAVA